MEHHQQHKVIIVNARAMCLVDEEMVGLLNYRVTQVIGCQFKVGLMTAG